MMVTTIMTHDDGGRGAWRRQWQWPNYDVGRCMVTMEKSSGTMTLTGVKRPDSRFFDDYDNDDDADDDDDN